MYWTSTAQIYTKVFIVMIFMKIVIFKSNGFSIYEIDLFI